MATSKEKAQANRAATINGDATGSVLEDRASTASGLLVVSDLDKGENQVKAIKEKSGEYGKFSISADGSWTYVLNKNSKDVQELAEGETVTEKFVVTSKDGSASKTVVVTVTGANDVASIKGDTRATLTEDSHHTTARGELEVKDLDHGQSSVQVVANQAGTYGAFSINAKGHWTYVMDNSLAATQALAQGEKGTDSFVVWSKDGSASQTVTVTLKGVNDEATITGQDTGSVSEDAAPNTATGQLIVNDVDNGENTVVPITAQAGAYGSFSIVADGSWTYTLDNSLLAVQSLPAGVTLTESFVVWSNDSQLFLNEHDDDEDHDDEEHDSDEDRDGSDHDGEDRDEDGHDDDHHAPSYKGASKVVTVTIVGTNDAAVITGSSTGAVTEDLSLGVSGQLNVVDIDTGESSFQAQSNTVGTYGSLSLGTDGAWSYALNNGADNVQALAAGEAATDTFVVKSYDGTEQQITLTLTGTNDLATISGSSIGAVTEDTALVTGAALAVADVDHGEAVFQAQAAVAATYGSFAIGTDGNWTYALNNSAANVQALAAGEQVTDSFIVTSFDGTASQLVEIAITGTNDGPVVVNSAAAAVGAVAEDGTLSATGQLSASDVDNGATQTWSVAGTANGAYGAIGIDAVSGQWTYNLNNAAANVQALAAGEIHVETFTLRVTDDQGAAADQQVSVTVTGSNDGPVVSTTAGGAAGVVTEDTTTVASGQLSVSDVDTGATQAWSVQGGAAGSYGSIAVDAATGQWTYNLNNGAANVQALKQGESHIETFTVRAIDDMGASVDQLVNVTVTGTNDGIVISAQDISGAVTEQGLPTSNLTDSGVITFSDVDLGDVLHLVSASGTPVGTTLGVLTVTKNNDTNGAGVGGKITWAYSVADTLVEGLAAGQTKVESFNITLNDQHGSVITKQIDVTITGTNDAPSFAAIYFDNGGTLANMSSPSGYVWHTDNFAGAVEVRSGGTFGVGTTSSTIELERNANDASNLYTYVAVKAGDTYTVEFDYSPRAGIQNASSDVSVFWGGSLVGHLSGTTTAGLKHYSIQVPSSVDGTSKLEFKADTRDSAGGILDNISVQQSGATLTEQVAPVGNLNVQGVIGFLDKDGSDSHLISNTGTPIGNALGTLAVVNNSDSTGSGVGGKLTWTYTVADSAVEYLAAGQTKVESFTISIDDQHGGVLTKQIDITIKGTNDAPVITNAATATYGVLVEDAVVQVSGQLTASDVDSGATQTWSVQGDAVGTYGSITVGAATGEWTYNLNNGAANVQALAADETHTETFTVRVTDEQGATAEQQVNVTVTGTNDGPTGTATVALAAGTEDATYTVTASDLLAGFSDVDNGAVLSVSGLTASDGAVTDNGDGTFTVSPSANFNGDVTLNYNVVDSQGGSVASALTYTVAAVNDVATITGNASGAIAEDFTSSVTGALSVDDVDSGQAQLQTISQQLGNYGSFSVDANGNWTYDWPLHSLDGKGGPGGKGGAAPGAEQAYQARSALAAGETGTDTFTVTSLDGTATQDVVVTVVGANDAASFYGQANGEVTEDGMSGTAGTLSVQDVDHDQAYAQAAAASGDFGDFNVDANGNWTYDLAQAPAADGKGGPSAAYSNLQALTAGQTVTETFSVTSLDGTATQEVSVVVIGTNDAATIAGTSTGTVTEDSTLTTTGTLTVADVDTGEAQFQAQANVAGAHGTFAIDAAGQWTYALNNAAAEVQALNTGDSLSDSFTVLSLDGTASQVVTVGITGTNDAPVLQGTQTEQLYTSSLSVWTPFLVNNGVWVTPTGASSGDTVQHTFVRQFTAAQDGNYVFQFAVDNEGSVLVDGVAIAGLYNNDWAHSTVQTVALTAGIHTVTMNALNWGGPAAFAMNITDPSNHEIWNTRTHLDPEPLILSYTENQAAIVVSSGLTLSDIDSPTFTQATVAVGTGFAAGDILSFADQNGITGVYDSATGVLGLSGLATQAQYQAALRSVTYSNSSDSPSTADRTINFTVDDGAGQSNLSNTVKSKIVILAVNDAPVGVETAVLTAGTEDTAYNVSAADLLTGFSDVDNGDVLSVSGLSASIGSVLDNHDGSFTITPTANFNGAVTLNYNVVDGKGGSIAATQGYTLTSVNDVATISGSSSGTVTEDTTLISSGTLTVSDVDTGEATFAVQTGVAGTYGTFNVDAAGQWTYALNNAAANVQALAAGKTVTETFAVQSQDGTASQDVVVTVTGQNDAPVAEAVKLIMLPTYAGATSLNILSPTDVDGDVLAVAVTSVPTNGTIRDGSNNAVALGTTLTSTQLAGLTFTPSAGSPSTTSTFAYTVSDGHGGTDSASIATSVLSNPITTTELISNGGFETNSLSGWRVYGSSGTFYVDSASPSPTSGHAHVGPASGTYFAISDENGPTVSAIEQSFNVTAGSTGVTLSFDMFVNNWNASTIANVPLTTSNSGQYARVDLLSAGSPTLDLATVIRNLYSGADNVNGTPLASWKHYSFDISQNVLTGGTFDLRFAQLDTNFYLNMGVDNVSVKINGTTVGNTIVGTAGNDVLGGGSASDTLTGGSGSDTFVYQALSDRGATGDVITDFTTGNGGDILNLHNLLTSISAPHDATAFSTGRLQFLQSGANTLVQIDADGAGPTTPVTLVTLTGISLTQTDVANYLL